MGTATRSKWIIQALEANLSDPMIDTRMKGIETAGKDTRMTMTIIVSRPLETWKERLRMRGIMEFKRIAIYGFYAFCLLCIGFSISKAAHLYFDVKEANEEISKEQKEMRDFLKAWQQAV